MNSINLCYNKLKSHLCSFERLVFGSLFDRGATGNKLAMKRVAIGIVKMQTEFLGKCAFMYSIFFISDSFSAECYEFFRSLK